jgi:hypothetical protein
MPLTPWSDARLGPADPIAIRACPAELARGGTMGGPVARDHEHRTNIVEKMRKSNQSLRRDGGSDAYALAS